MEYKYISIGSLVDAVDYFESLGFKMQPMRQVVDRMAAEYVVALVWKDVPDEPAMGVANLMYETSCLVREQNLA